ncbi:MAG: AIR carboxylase family protein [Candidatus Aenigmarchaeota archaeon]|nr:AIR carboxylase family protein [Candidatus Aenigmarchaeota archaeon]
MVDYKAVIIMGSPSDRGFADKIAGTLDELKVPYTMRIASAHRTPRRVLDIIEKEEVGSDVVYITVAGRSNALSGMVDAQTSYPVIACPPYSSDFGGADVYSSLRTPGGVAPLVVLEPGNAALAAAKILGMMDDNISDNVMEYQRRARERVEQADEELQSELMKKWLAI